MPRASHAGMAGCSRRGGGPARSRSLARHGRATHSPLQPSAARRSGGGRPIWPTIGTPQIQRGLHPQGRRWSHAGQPGCDLLLGPVTELGQPVVRRQDVSLVEGVGQPAHGVAHICRSAHRTMLLQMHELGHIIGMLSARSRPDRCLPAAHRQQSRDEYPPVGVPHKPLRGVAVSGCHPPRRTSGSEMR